MGFADWRDKKPPFKMKELLARKGVNEVTRGLYVGGFSDGMDLATKQDWVVFFVHEHYGEFTPLGATWRPFLKSFLNLDGHLEVTGVDAPMLESLLQEIHQAHEDGMQVLIYSVEGIERAPLAIACYLHRYGDADTLEDAFAMVQAKHPGAIHRLAWLDRAKGE